MESKTKISLKTIVDVPVVKVWEYWTAPKHIIKWNKASEDWHTTKAENDLEVGGRFSSRMEAKDGSMGFDFGGTYDEIRLHEFISYTLDDGRGVSIIFSSGGNKTSITETFEAESANPVEIQRAGWQAILDNFKKYTESLK